MSLTAHLTANSAGHGRLAFHPDCPRCRAERLAGSLADDELAARKVAAALAAILAALPAAAPAAVAQTPGREADPQEPPPSAPPGIGIEVDPGDGSVPDTYTAPTEGGGDDDESEGPPVDTAPADEPVGATPPTEAPAPAPEPTTPSAPEPAETAPAAPPSPAPAPAAPSPAPPPPQPPAPAPEAGELIEAPEGRAAGGTVRQVRIGVEPRPRTAPTGGQAAAPVPTSVEIAEPPVAADTRAATTPITEPSSAVAVPVSQPASPPAREINGDRYTVQTGDSLWSIARRILGPDASAGRIAREVNRLWELNSERIGTGDPSLIHVGTVLEL